MSSTGNDAAACTLAAPCRSFAAAIARTSAFGEVIVLDSAGYGPVTITKSISIIAPHGIYAGITVATGDGIVVDSLGAIVALRGLSINGQGGNIGINLQHATRVHIEGCVISNMASNGILHAAPFAQLFVQDTIVRNTSGTGIGVAADASVVLDRVHVEHNFFDGFYVVPGATLAKVAINDSVFAWNGGTGIRVDSLIGASTAVTVQRSTLADNGAAGFAATGYGAATISHSSILRNGTAGVDIVGSGQEFAVTVADNSIVDNPIGIRADGSLAAVFATRNALADVSSVAFSQSNGAYFGSLGDNLGKYGEIGTISTAAGH